MAPDHPNDAFTLPGLPVEELQEPGLRVSVGDPYGHGEANSSPLSRSEDGRCH